MTAATMNTEPEAGARERLLTAALTLFNEKGYAATSVRELVQAAGVTKPVLYYYFGNKEGIFLELMAHSYSTFQSLAAEIGSLEGSARERIARFSSELFEASLENLPLVRLIYAIFYGPPQGTPQFDIEAFFLGMIQVTEALVRDGMAKGELRQDSVEDVARAIVAILSSSINEQICRKETKLDRDGMLRMLDLLMQGIVRQP